MVRHVSPVLDGRLAATVLAVIAVLAAGGCGSTDDSDEASSSESTSEATEPSQSSGPSDDASTDPAYVPEGSVAGDGYTVAVPEGWTDMSDQASEAPKLARADLVLVDSTDRTFTSNLTSYVTPTDGGSLRHPHMRERLADRVERILKVRPTPVAEVQLDGETAIGQTATLRRANATMTQYLALREDKLYTLTVTLSAARAGESDAIVGDIVDSWQWTDG